MKSLFNYLLDLINKIINLEEESKKKPSSKIKNTNKNGEEKMISSIDYVLSRDYFDDGLKFVEKIEGGFVDDPDDRGGRTNMGITQKTYDEWKKSLGKKKKDVKNIKYDEVRRIYRSKYWLACNCDIVSTSLAKPKLGIALFDFSVNSGCYNATRFLQEVLDITSDGIFGPQTKKAIKDCNEQITVNIYLERRRVFYERIVKNDSSQEKFLNGWMKRVDWLEKYLDKID